MLPIFSPRESLHHKKLVSMKKRTFLATKQALSEERCHSHLRNSHSPNTQCRKLVNMNVSLGPADGEESWDLDNKRLGEWNMASQVWQFVLPTLRLFE